MTERLNGAGWLLLSDRERAAERTADENLPSARTPPPLPAAYRQAVAREIERTTMLSRDESSPAAPVWMVLGPALGLLAWTLLVVLATAAFGG